MTEKSNYDSEYINVWKYLYLNKVSYLTVVKNASHFESNSRSASDICLLIEKSHSNRINIIQSINDLGIGDFEEIESFDFNESLSAFKINLGLHIDLPTSIYGLDIEDFKELYSHSQMITMLEIPVHFVDYSNMILTDYGSNFLDTQTDDDEHEQIKMMNDADDYS